MSSATCWRSTVAVERVSGSLQSVMMELTTWVAPAAAVLAAVVAAWIGASNRQALARAERRANIDAQLSDKRQKLYTEVLRPWVLVITPDAVWNTDPETKGKDKQQLVQEAMLNQQYRQAMFQLTFVGTDEVVEALNDLMQHFYKAGASPQPQADHGRELARLLAGLLLAIRKGAGNDETRLDKWGMLEPFMNDARNNGRENGTAAELHGVVWTMRHPTGHHQRRRSPLVAGAKRRWAVNKL